MDGFQDIYVGWHKAKQKGILHGPIYVELSTMGGKELICSDGLEGRAYWGIQWNFGGW